MANTLKSKLGLVVSAVTEEGDEFNLIFGENSSIKDIREILEENNASEVRSLGWAESLDSTKLSVDAVEKHSKDFVREDLLSKRPIGRGLEAFF